MSLSNLSFELGALSIIGFTYFTGYDVDKGNSGKVVQALPFFLAASLIDRTLRYLLVRNTKKVENSLTEEISSALLEEGMYSGVLLTQSKMWMIPRFGVSLVQSMTAARALIAIPVKPKVGEGFTVDVKIGFLWAVARETLSFFSPKYCSISVLLLGDGAVFALAEVCPSKRGVSIEKYSSNWYYKVISAVCFRILANSAALKIGLVAPITQHLLFNISRALT